ncbi:phthioceranic/hydroxyphthioceranic acid synthase-like isoform X2 [Argopecten irradians]
MDDGNDIVIVGVGCKFPGADDLDEFWRVLSEGENHVIEIPRERWNNNAFYHEDPNEPGKSYVTRAGFIKKYDEWDYKLFNVNKMEAATVDPQQRYVLDCVHMAMEDGGITRRDLNGSNTGVYIGVMNDDYKVRSSDDLNTMTNYSLTGTSTSIISARVSYTYNLLGPSMSIDTACSSALVAIHTASQALKSGDCDVAICGGVNSILYPDIFVPLSKARMVSPTGQCQAFSNKADGYARGEGCGIVILKTKKQAVLDGNKIWAAIATGCNQDGRTTTPITAPSSNQQRNLLVKVYSKTGIDPNDIQYIEAHGTGTPVGDPIETNTLGEFFAQKRQNGDSYQNNILLGSVKTNIGHLESAAGAAGLVKVLLMMQNEKIVPSLHYDNPNPNISFDEFRLEVARNMSQWPCLKKGGRLSCVNSFGFGGTNSHAVIKQYRVDDFKEEKKTRKSNRIIAVTGSDIRSLGKNLYQLKENIHKAKYCLEDISYTSTCRRDHYAYRTAFLVKTKEDVVRNCNEHLHQLQTIKPAGFSKPNMVFVFCGVGTAWTGMCQELLNKEDKFTETVREIDRILTPLAGWSIIQTLTDGFDISDPLKSHLAIFTCQVAMAKLWNHLGIQPDIIVGQSVGEVAAAYAAGVLSIEDAVRVIYERSRILDEAKGGTMCVIGNCNVSLVGDTCKKFRGKVNIAVNTSPKACTLTGDRDAIEEAIKILEKENKDKSFIRRLNVQCAYHSHYMESASEKLETALCGLKGMEPHCKLISTVTGEFAMGNEFVSPQYWAKNVRQPVLLQHAITKAQSDKTFNIYLEIGPKPVLRFHLGDIVGTGNATALPSMTEKKELDMLQLSMIELFKHGIDPCWSNIVTTASLTDLPKCSFSPVKLLFQSDVTLLKISGVRTTQSSHLFVERAGGDEIRFKINISPTTTWFLYEHVVSGTIVVPGAFYIDVALQIAMEFGIKGQKNISVSAQFVQPLHLNKAEPCKAEAYVEHLDDGLSIHVLKNKVTSARCQIRESDGHSLETVDVEAIRKRCTVHQSATETYQNLKRLGFSYGSELKILGNALKSDNECLVQMKLTDRIIKDIDATHLHPAILDGLLQTTGVFNLQTNIGTTLLPAGIESIMTRQSPEKKMLAFATLVSHTKQRIRYNALLLTEDGRIIAEIRNFFIQCIGSNNKDEEDSMYEVRWEKKEMKVTSKESQHSGKEQQNSVVISLDRSDAEIFDSEINNMSSYHLATHDEYFESKLTDYLRMSGHTCINSLIFSVNKEKSLDQLTGEEVMKRVSANACALLKICQQLVNLRIDLPVLIITEKTQGPGVSQNQVENVIGSELWGMARSIVLEYPLQLTLIDRHVPLRQCSSTIEDLLIYQNPQLCSEAELLVTTNKVYFNRLVPQQELPREYKWISIENSDRVHLKSRRPDNVEDKFCLLQDIEPIPKGMFMEVEQAVMHDSALCSLTTQSAWNDIPIWASEKEDGFDILTFEICGKVTVHSDDKPPNQLEGMYAACSPFTLQSIVEVHQDCIVRIDDLPSYKPGTLRASAFLWHMKEYLVRGITLIITNGDDNVGEILRAMLPKPQASQVVIDTLDGLHNPDTQQYNVETVVILTTVTFATLCDLLDKTEGVHTCLSLELFGTMHTWQTARKKYGELSFIILYNEDILMRKNLSETILKVGKWLRKNLSKIQCDNWAEKTTRVVTLDSAKQQEKRVKVRKEQLFRRKSCYVIVGGLTGLGWEIVKYLATDCSTSIVILSRSVPNAAQTREISKLEKLTSTSIKALSADITSIGSLEKAFTRIENYYGQHSVKGIFHGGAVLNDGLFINQTNESFKKVLLPKVLGSWNLHTFSKRYDLDFFILHSSVASVIGNKGQSNYSAGNAFMDSLAHYRAANDYPGLSINWGPLAVGMAADNAVQEELERSGYMFLGVRITIDSLVKTLMSDGNQILVGIFDWSLVESQFTDVSLERVRRRFRRVMNNDNKRNMQAISAELVGNHYMNTTEGITSFVIDVASLVFATDANMISISTSLMNLGIDSMVAMTFMNTINGATNCAIPVVLLMSEETTIETIVDYLETNIKQTTDMTRKQTDVAKPDDLTHMEKEYFIPENIDASHLFTYVDFEASGHFANKEIWKALLGHVVMKHEALRTHFVQRRDSYGKSTYTRVVTPAEKTELYFKVVERGSINRNERIPSDMTMYRFFPETDFPLRLLFEEADGKCYIRMVFSHLTFDMTSIMLVLEDIQNFKINADVQVPGSMTKDIAGHVNERLREHENALKEYWKRKIPAGLSSLSMADTEREIPQEINISTTTAHIPQQLVLKLAQFCRNNEITQFQLMVTAYQILLHVVTRVDTICVLTLADMRMLFPQFQRDIGCMVNKVPLFLSLSKERTINNLLIENGKDIWMMLNSGLYPFRQIVNEVSARNDDPDAIFRHMLVYRDFQRANTEEKGGYVKLLNAVSPNNMHETVMVVWNDRINRALNLELEHNTLIISKPEAESILQLLISLLEYLIDHGDSTMNDMTREFNHAAQLIHPVGSEINRTSGIKQTTDMTRRQTDVAKPDDLTHMEKEYFIPENIDASHLFTYVDFEASGHFANTEMWKALLEHVVMKHAALRTHFVQRRDSYGKSTYTRVVTPAEKTELNFKVVERGSINRNERIPSDMTMYRFFPETDFPLRLLFEEADGKCYIRMVFSHLTFDMTSIMLVLEDIQNFKINADVQVPGSMTKDIAGHVNERLREHENALKEYWKRKIPAGLSSLSMADTEREIPQEINISTTTAHIPQQLVLKLAQFCRNNEITQFQLMVTAYQILLHVVTRVDTICVLTLADMRMLFPQFQRDIGCMVNKVPLFLSLSKERTINNLLIENGKDIWMMLNSGLYPFRQIVNEVSARNDDPDAIFRHMLVYRDFQRANTEEKGGYVKLLNAVSPNNMHETVMVVWNDRINRALNLELEHNTLIISKPEAESILQLLISILEYLIDHGDSTMNDMTREFNHAAQLIHPVGSEINRTSEISIASGEFLKQTRNGWNHRVQLSVCRDQDGDQVLVKWRRTKNHRSREIYGKDIESVDRGTCNGLHALTVSTKERNERVYTFMTPNKQLCDTITSCLLDRLEGARTKGQNTKL